MGTNHEKAGLVGFGIGFGYAYHKTHDPYNTIFGVSPDAVFYGVFTGAMSYVLFQVAYLTLTEFIL